MDEYGDVPGQGGNQYATLDTVLPESNIHHQGTIPGPGGRLTFWMYNPSKVKVGVGLRCGVCKTNMTGLKHCPRCYRHRNGDADVSGD